MKYKLLFVCSLVCLSGCDSVKRGLGLGKQSPDAFKVLSRDPLTLPPNFEELPQPTPGALRPQEKTPEQKAKDALIGGKSTSHKTTSKAERSLLAKVGTAEDNIRAELDRDVFDESHTGEKNLAEMLNLTKTKKGVVIDAKEESERLRQEHGANVAQQQPTAEAP